MDVEEAKRAAGRAAAELVEDDMTLGLGTGSTAHWFIVSTAKRARDEGLRLRGVATSRASEELAGTEGIPIVELGTEGVDLAVDGADCVDPRLRLIKGGGGAHVREKIVAAAARRFVVVVDAAKMRGELAGALPVELVPFGVEHTLAALGETGASFSLRRDGDGAPLMSDNGNLLADGDYGTITDAEELAGRLDAIPGLVGHGLFLGMTDLVLTAHADGRIEEVHPDGRGAPTR
ncbi:MAG: ribose-5-phosphate isomerase RpiA [Candidatus Dormibacteria bacterium]